MIHIRELTTCVCVCGGVSLGNDQSGASARGCFSDRHVFGSTLDFRDCPRTLELLFHFNESSRGSGPPRVTLTVSPSRGNDASNGLGGKGGVSHDRNVTVVVSLTRRDPLKGQPPTGGRIVCPVSPQGEKAACQRGFGGSSGGGGGGSGVRRST